MEFICYAGWQELPESADTLFDEAAKESVFFSRPWFENLSNTVIEDQLNLVIACVIDDDQVLAILPLIKKSTEHWHALTHLYTSLYTLLLAEHHQQEVLHCLVQGIDQLAFISLKFEPVAEDDKNMQQLQQLLEARGYQCYRKFRFYNWIHRSHGQSYEEYMATRPSRSRNTIARKQRKLEREHQYKIRLFTDQDIEQGLTDYLAVYSSSWKAKELFNSFIAGLADSLAKAGWLRLAVLSIEGKPAAAQFWFVVHGKASIFKLAYDEAWKKYSTGSILTSFLMQQVIDVDHVEEIDFLTGNDAYKQEWMSQRRERLSLHCTKPVKPTGKLNAFLKFFKGIGKQQQLA